MNQFFYKRVTYAPKKNPEDKEEKPVELVWEDSFNLDKVIRSMEFEKEIVVLLDDGHEQADEVPVRNKKGGVDYVRQRVWSQSEIHIKDPEDKERFKKISEAV